jgi:hypothetical protein
MTKDEKAKKQPEKTELLEARAVMGDLLLQEKQYQAMLRQLGQQINGAILKVQELSKE